MADAIVERRTLFRFFCHRCLLEYEDNVLDFVCPYCEGGFIEQLEERESLSLLGDDFSDADMSNIEDMSNIDDIDSLNDSDEVHRSTPFNDLAFLMSGSRIRARSSNSATGASEATSNTGTGTGTGTGQRRPTLMEELIWMIGGGRPPAGAMTAGAPFVLVGTPGDYVFGGDGLDAVVTQLLGQLEHSGPPPMTRERLAAIPTEQVTEEQASANITCSVCWENYQLGETTSRLECDHVFHQSCITPWLQLHATCPVCRRSLIPPAEVSNTTPPTTTGHTARITTIPPPGALPLPPLNLEPNSTPEENVRRLAPRVIIRTSTRPGLFRRFHAQWDSINGSSTSSSPASSITTGGSWAPQTRSNNSTGSNSSINNDIDRQYNTDMDCD